MKIVKEFEDPEFMANPRICGLEDVKDYKWIWGLGDDGNLYYRCTRLEDPNVWWDLKGADYVAPLITLKHMKKIVKEFGHLLAFL